VQKYKVLSRHRLPYRLDMQRITLTVLLLSYPSRPAITRPGWGLRRMAHGTANDWCADERSGGRDAHMTTRSASTLPRLPWDCCHEANVAPRADLCSATGGLTASRYGEAAWPPSLAPPYVAEVWRGAQDLVLIWSTTIMVEGKV
jgi:hypothetical protein